MNEVAEKIKQKSFMAGTGRIILVKDVLKILERRETINIVLIEQLNEVIREQEQKLQEFLAFLYSQAPLFCTHGKNELDCMKSTSPCKRKHQKECQVYLRISKFVELFGLDTKKEKLKQ